MSAKIDPKVVMDLSIFKVGRWNSLQPINRKLLGDFWWEWTLVVGRNSKQRSTLCDTVLGTTLCEHLKKLMSFREGLHVMMQCYMRQHFADRHRLHEHPGGHASWREPTMRKFTKESTTYFAKGLVCKWNVQKMRSESSEYVRNTSGFFTNSWRIKTALESYFDGRETGWTLRCRQRSWTRILQNWLRRFWRHVENNSKRVISWMQLTKLQAQ